MHNVDNSFSRTTVWTLYSYNNYHNFTSTGSHTVQS